MVFVKWKEGWHCHRKKPPNLSHHFQQKSIRLKVIIEYQNSLKSHYFDPYLKRIPESRFLFRTPYKHISTPLIMTVLDPPLSLNGLYCIVQLKRFIGVLQVSVFGQPFSHIYILIKAKYR